MTNSDHRTYKNTAYIRINMLYFYILYKRGHYYIIETLYSHFSWAMTISKENRLIRKANYELDKENNELKKLVKDLEEENSRQDKVIRKMKEQLIQLMVENAELKRRN